MKKYLFASVIILSLTTVYAQVEIVTNGNVGINEANPQRQLHVVDENEIQLILENKTSDGAGVRLENSNNYQWEMMNDNTNIWGNVNALGFFNRSGGGYIPLVIMPNNTVHIPLAMHVGGYSTFKMLQVGETGAVNGFDFNTDINTGNVDGLLLMQSINESSGIYFDSDYCTIFSPGDQNRLLRIYDEDGMIEKFYIDGSGVPHTNSDSTRKQNIKNLETSTDKLAQLKGKKYYFKEEVQEDFEPQSMTFPKGMIAKDSTLVPITKGEKETKYDPSKREYFGFLAQDVEKVFPNLVDTNEKGEKFVSYTEFIPLLVDGYNQQTQQIQTQQEELAAMNEKLLQLEKLVEVMIKNIK